MASTVLKNTFVSTYKDDFRDSDNYHRILFNSARPLQARELTQSQTIIQRELERFARYIFNEGSLLTSSLGDLSTDRFSISFVKLDTVINPLPANYNELIGTNITNTGEIASPITARIKAITPAAGSDPATLFVEYIDAGDNDPINATTPQIFRAGQTLTTNLGSLTVQTTNTVANPATGRGSIISVPSSELFVLGHFVFVPSQTKIISKYSSIPSEIIGYTVTENIITAADNVALYDNQGSTPNLTSPGADRYQIRLTLSIQSEVAATDTFIPLIKLTNGIPVALQNADNILNRIGDTIANRTKEESGNYIVRGNSTFELQVLDDSDDDYLIYSIQPGVAYINGRRVEKTVSDNSLRVLKPRRDPEDITSITGENVAANYGNYLLADSMYGLIDTMTVVENGTGVDNVLNLYNAADVGGTIIGTARIRAIDEVDDNYRIHLFNLDMDSNGSGVTYNTNAIRSIGSSSTNFANTVSDAGVSAIYNQNQNTMLFPLPGTRPQEILDVSVTVGEVFTATTNGSGQAIINTSNAAHEFADEDQWILAYDSDGVVVPSPTVDSGGAGTNQVRLSGLVAGKGIHMLAYVNISAAVRPKSLIQGAEETVAVTNGTFKLTKADVFGFNSIVDATTSEDITYKFITDRGQRDNYYDVGQGRLRSGYSAPAGNIVVNYDYFSHGSGDFFAVNSYNNIDYKDIPVYVNSNGNRISLRDVIDFRAVRNSTGTGYTGTGAIVPRIPRNRDIISITTTDYYNARIDSIFLNDRGELITATGASSLKPVKPVDIPSTMRLNNIQLQPYTTSKREATIEVIDNTGYKMSDIRKLETRISNLEELTTLTLGELSTKDIEVVDENGVDRTKLGLTVDTFKDHSQSLLITTTKDQRAAIDRVYQQLRPIIVRRHLPMYYDSDASTNTIQKGDTIWPKYTEEVLINQNVASTSVNVNQFTIPKFVGSMTLKPDHDNWVEARTTSRNGTTVVVKDGDLSTYDTFFDYGKQSN